MTRTILSSASQEVTIGFDQPFVMIGERINPTGRKILAREMPEAEVVFNEWGVLRVLRTDYPALKPVMGRLLNRMKRGPRLMGVIDRLPPTTAHYFRSNYLNIEALTDFLGEF